MVHYGKAEVMLIKKILQRKANVFNFIYGLNDPPGLFELSWVFSLFEILKIIKVKMQTNDKRTI